MRKLLLIPFAALALVVASPAQAATTNVQITKNGFVPAKVTVVQGDTVTWRNVDTANHQVVADDGSFASLTLKTGDTYSATFSKAGAVKYHDPYTKAGGTITVTAPPTPAGVTLSASAQSVVYGGSAQLTGTVSNGQASESVQLLTQEAGQSKMVQTAQVDTTTTGGTFAFAVNPTIQTAYQVQWKDATSHAVTVYVAPRVTISRRGGIFRTSAVSDRSYFHRYVLFQRLNRAGSWSTIRKVTLGSSSTAAFRARLPRGYSRVRIWMNAGQAGFGYIAGHSATLLVRR